MKKSAKIADSPLKFLATKKTMQIVEEHHTVIEVGLYNGKTGILIALYNSLCLLDKKNHSAVKKTITKLLNDISENAGSSNDSYSNGIFGIGWGINNLYSKGFILKSKFEVLNSFDDEIYKLVMFQKAGNNDLETGTMGRINFYLNRIEDDLKLRNKYRYIANYEVLMLLVNNFTNENDMIIGMFSKSLPMEELLNNGIYYCKIYNLLSLLIKKNIQLEITERQQLHFLKSFAQVIKKIFEEMTPYSFDEKRYWSTMSMLACLLARDSEIIRNVLRPFKFSIQKLLNEKSFRCSNIEKLIIKLAVLESLNGEPTEQELIGLIDSCEWQHSQMGLNGLAGIVNLLVLHKDISCFSETFLLNF